MSGQHLDQYVVDDYIRETGILSKVQTGLNMAIEKSIKNPESFLADYLLQGVVAKKNCILVHSIHINSRGQILYTINYLNVLRTFSFQLEPEVVTKISDKPISLPILVLETLTGLDLTIDFSELCDKVKEVLPDNFDVIIHHFMSVISNLLRKPYFDTLLYSLRRDKQLYEISRLMVGVLESPLVKFYVVQTVQKSYKSVMASYQALQTFLDQIDASRTLCSLQTNEKTGEVSVPGFQFTLSEVILRDRDEMMKWQAECELNKDIRKREVVPEVQKGGKGAPAAPALTTAQVVVLLARNLQAALNGHQDHLGVFLVVDLGKLVDQKVIFNEKERGLYLLLLNMIMEFSMETTVHFTGFKNVPNEIQRPPSAKGGKGAKAVETEDVQCYNKQEALEDIVRALKDVRDLKGIEIPASTDQQIDIQGLKIIQEKNSENQFTASTSLQMFYQKLYQIKDKGTNKEEETKEQNQEQEAEKAKTLICDAEILLFSAPEESDRPASGKGGKAPAKGAAKGKNEVEKPEKCKFISLGEASILERKEFVYLDDKDDINDFIGGVWQIIQEKRGVLGL